MATETGQIIRLENNDAVVRITRTDACSSCSQKNNCGVMTGDSHKTDIRVANKVAAQPGDMVTVEIGTGSLLKAAFLLYLFPILCMMIAATMGKLAADALGINETAPSMGMGLGFFILSFVVVRIRGNKMARKEAYRPRITRIRHRASSRFLKNGGHTAAS